MSWKQTLFSGILVVLSTFVAGATVAAQSSSDNYHVNEFFFGVGGELEACSDSYCAKQAAGETTVGSASSDNYMMQAGFNTTDVPLLEVAVNGSIDFGVLSPNSTATGYASVQVRTYLSSGYDIRVVGLAPSYTTGDTTNTLDAMASPGAVEAGTEQFGINLRANTSPIVGADTVQVPDETFSFGLPTTNYNTPNSFMYQSEDVVAYSDRSSGQTNYTLSMIANMAPITPAGRYTTSLSVVVTASF
jgi:hypothetical protein